MLEHSNISSNAVLSFQNNSLSFSVTLLSATPDPRSHRLWGMDARPSGPSGRHSSRLRGIRVHRG